MTIAVLLQTCGREDLTRRTVETFCKFNGYPGGRLSNRFELVHADDESVSPENMEIAGKAGFRTVFAPKERRGQMAGLKAMCAALPDGVEWIAYLENDWETVGEWPWLLSDCPFVETIRLFADRKAQQGPRALAGNKCLASGRDINWVEEYATISGVYQPDYHWAEAHFVAPSITRADVLLPLVRSCATVKDICRARPLRSVRPVENAVWHLGDTVEKQTPGFMA